VTTSQVNQIRDQQERAQAIVVRLEQQADTLRVAERMRRAAMLTIGDLLRAARQLDTDRKALDDPRLGSRVEITEAAGITGLSRPTLYQLAAERPPDDGPDLRALSNQAVARMHVGYGYGGGHERVDAEFWSRYPHLHGWYNAIAHLYDAQVANCEDIWEIDARQEQQGPPPGADVLRAEYQRQVDRIAAGG
jgi:hypothetical protein